MGSGKYEVTIYLATQASPQSLVVDMKGHWGKHRIEAKAFKREHGLWKNDILAGRFG